MTDTILIGARWTLRAERAEGAPEGMYTTECRTCPASSGWVDNEVTKVGVWAIQHTAASGHPQFVTTTQTPWRVDPTHRSGTHPSTGTSPQPARHRPGHHPFIAPRGVKAIVGRLAGPLVITALISVATLCGYLLGADTGPD